MDDNVSLALFNNLITGLQYIKIKRQTKTRNMSAFFVTVIFFPLWANFPIFLSLSFPKRDNMKEIHDTIILFQVCFSFQHFYVISLRGVFTHAMKGKSYKDSNKNTANFEDFISFILKDISPPQIPVTYPHTILQSPTKVI